MRTDQSHPLSKPIHFFNNSLLIRHPNPAQYSCLLDRNNSWHKFSFNFLWHTEGTNSCINSSRHEKNRQSGQTVWGHTRTFTKTALQFVQSKFCLQQKNIITLQDRGGSSFSWTISVGLTKDLKKQNPKNNTFSRTFRQQEWEIITKWLVCFWGEAKSHWTETSLGSVMLKLTLPLWWCGVLPKQKDSLGTWWESMRPAVGWALTF